MKLSRRGNILIVLLIAVIIAASVFFVLSGYARSREARQDNQNNILSEKSATPVYIPPEKLSNPPEIIKAVYVTGYSAGSKKYLDYLSNLFKTTEINAVVVDIKDYSGLVSYKSDASDAKKYELYNYAISDINALVRFFHSQNIYVIGRIVVFEDPAFSKLRPDLSVYKTDTTHPTSSGQADLLQPASPEPSGRVLWQDNNKLSWLDPASKDVWNYNISLAKDAFLHGFDEINFDYVRFPSDGNMENIGFPIWDGKTPMAEIIKEFFQYVRANFPGDPPSLEASAGQGKISVDLFGQTTTNTDDMGIGQVIESAFENFDYVSPMVYPSHYINGFMGFDNPAEHPYEIVKYSMDSALARESIFLKQQQDLTIKNSGATGLHSSVPIKTMVSLSKFRPWLQDFDMGADYTADMVKAEINATKDSLGNDFNGYMLWNPSNIYTQGAIEKIRQAESDSPY